MIIKLANSIINKMNKMQLEYFLICYFNKISFELKELSILKYADFVLKEKDVKNYNVEIKELQNGVSGYCEESENSKKIILNKCCIHNDDIFTIIGTIFHECKHAIQNNLLEMSKTKQSCKNEYLKKLDYCKNKSNIDIKFCNFDFKNISLHIRLFPSNLSDYNAKSSIFYHLNLAEREAFLEEEKIFLFLEKKYNTHIQKYNISQDVDNFNKLYHCNLSMEEVFDVIDQCYENLVEHKNPSHTDKGNLIATVMYDLCLVACYNSGQLSEKTIQELSTFQVKQKILAKEDYFVYGIKSYQRDLLSKKEQREFVENPELLKTLSKTEQNLNPILIWNVILKNRNKGADFFNGLLKDKNSFFKQIVENETSREMCKECLSTLFGKEFEVCLNEYKKQKNSQIRDNFGCNGNGIVQDILEGKEDYER